MKRDINYVLSPIHYMTSHLLNLLEKALNKKQKFLKGEVINYPVNPNILTLAGGKALAINMKKSS